MSQQPQYSSICPACGKSNACALSEKTLSEKKLFEHRSRESADAQSSGLESPQSDASAGSCGRASEQGFACWCASVRITEQTKQVLNAKTDGKCCLCQACLEALIASSR